MGIQSTLYLKPTEKPQMSLSTYFTVMNETQNITSQISSGNMTQSEYDQYINTAEFIMIRSSVRWTNFYITSNSKLS